MKLLVTIGVDDPLLGSLKEVIDGRIVAYPNVPRMLSHGGQTYVASQTVMDHWLRPDGIIYYGYYFDQHVPAARKALALSDTPTFPDVRRTLAHDDRAVSLALAMAEDRPRGREKVSRGYMPEGERHGFTGRMVIKEGNSHCGEGVSLFAPKPDWSDGFKEGIVEPLFEGRSERILVIGHQYTHLRYESLDWRKNVGTTSVTEIVDEVTPDLVGRTSALVKNLGLKIAGVDFIINGDIARLLEVNTYPGLDLPVAQRAWLREAAFWWETVVANVPIKETVTHAP